MMLCQMHNTNMVLCIWHLAASVSDDKSIATYTKSPTSSIDLQPQRQYLLYLLKLLRLHITPSWLVFLLLTSAGELGIPILMITN